jgi:hypothetical protein
MKDTGLSVTLAGLEILSQSHVQVLSARADGLTHLGEGQVDDYDPQQELAGAAFLIVAAFGGFVGFVVAICWAIAR